MTIQTLLQQQMRHLNAAPGRPQSAQLFFIKRDIKARAVDE